MTFGGDFSAAVIQARLQQVPKPFHYNSWVVAPWQACDTHYADPVTDLWDVKGPACSNGHYPGNFTANRRSFHFVRAAHPGMTELCVFMLILQ